MGVPTFYRWLCTKYPKVVKDVIEERQVLVNDEWIMPDLMDRNPQGIEFDNLYIDMNGVVHNCAHPEEATQPETESEMFQNVCDYIDRIMNIVRPRKLLYLALDGVAPRAKMNQQRARRYKAAAEAETLEGIYHELSQEWEQEGRPPPIPPKKRWDSNQITPGTEFMERLASVLRYYVCSRIQESSYWSSLTILVSDSNVPGEGEHKVMALVRAQRAAKNYDPNTKHVMHGMDADLIMLALATHEPHFYIIREIVTDRPVTNDAKPEPPSINNDLVSSISSEQRKEMKESEFNGININKSFRASWKPLQFLQIPVLREYLKVEFNFSPQELCQQHPDTGDLIKIPSDLERHIDDFVMMCFFIGNDFLPHLPSLSVQKGSIDQMVALYKAIYPTLGSYLTNQGMLEIPAIKLFTSYLAKVEPQVFEEENKRKIYLERQRERRAQEEEERNREREQGQSLLLPERKSSRKDDVLSGSKSHTKAPRSSVGARAATMSREEAIDAFKAELAAKLESKNVVENPIDNIMLGVGDPSGWRRAHYMEKFHLLETDDIEDTARAVSAHFVRGLQWVLLYYFQGVASWEWFFPYHYAPLALDIHQYGLDEANLPHGLKFAEFKLGKPLQPLEQLMANLPPRSANFLPVCYAKLMTNPESPIADFYPPKFYEDQDGKRFRWQWVAQLPFIDSGRLIAAADAVKSQMDEASRQRNAPGEEFLVVGNSHKSAESILHATGAKRLLKVPSVCIEGMYANGSKASGHISGTLNEEGFRSFVPTSIACSYELCSDNPPHISELMSGAEPPPDVLTAEDKNVGNQPVRGRGPFNSQAAKRMILNVVGGWHADQLREQERIARETYHANIPHAYNAPRMWTVEDRSANPNYNSRNGEAQRSRGGYRADHSRARSVDQFRPHREQQDHRRQEDCGRQDYHRRESEYPVHKDQQSRPQFHRADQEHHQYRERERPPPSNYNYYPPPQQAPHDQSLGSQPQRGRFNRNENIRRRN